MRFVSSAHFQSAQPVHTLPGPDTAPRLLQQQAERAMELADRLLPPGGHLLIELASEDQWISLGRPGGGLPWLERAVVAGNRQVGTITLFLRDAPAPEAGPPLESLLDLIAHSLASAAQAEAEALHTLECERRFAATFEQSPVGIAHVGLDGHFLRVNDRFCAIAGHPREALMQHGFQQITHPDDLESDLAHVQRLIAGADDRYAMEKRYVRQDGSIVWVKLTVAVARDEAGRPEFFVSVLEDLSEIRRVHAEAMCDPLTGLLNRRGFVDRAGRHLARSIRARQPVALAYWDLDGFKAINDRMGHAAGDACLRSVAAATARLIRPGDALARLGGDEFALFMPQLSKADAIAIVDRLRGALDGLTQLDLPLSASFGLAWLIPEAEDLLDDVIARADQAMLVAKRAGKNRLEIDGRT